MSLLCRTATENSKNFGGHAFIQRISWLGGPTVQVNCANAHPPGTAILQTIHKGMSPTHNLLLFSAMGAQQGLSYKPV